MPLTHSLDQAQRLAAALDADVEAIARGLNSAAAHRHAVRAAGMLSAAVRELGGALIQEAMLARAAAAPLTAEVVTPGAPR